jgi:serine/threonine protein kinase
MAHAGDFSGTTLMDAESWARVRAVFDQLADAPPAQWELRLDALGIDDAALRNDVLALLRADQQALLQTDVVAQAPGMLSDLADDHGEAIHRSLAGQRMGAYRLLRELGRGGMGTVWLAERADGEFAQQVAIKLIRPGWDAREVLARFRAERQILAGLTHPNIAHLIDGGVTSDGRPWLALEYVDGVDLRTHCDRHRLDLGQRLRLFDTVCAAVSHAHAHLVVHRDIKPSNLLVTAAGEVKLLDFGIAKLIDTEAQVSATRVFTPEYAAPEQVRGEVVTTAVDVYALGLLLYELLTGRRPYKVADSTPAAYERAILDQEPTRPSVAVTRNGDDAEAIALAAQRELTPQRLRSELRGDLDAIVLKALRKDPLQRYPSVAEFAADIRRHIDRQPVLARRGGLRYRATRFLRRHALATALAASAVIALAAGLAVAMWQASEARTQRDIARSEGAKSNQTVQFLLDIFRSADPAATQGRKVTAEELLQRGVERVEHARIDDAAVRYDLLMAMGEAYLGIGASRDAFAVFDKALRLQETQLADDARKRVRTLVQMARSRGGKDEVEAAKANLDEASRLLPVDAAESELAADLYVSRGINRMSRSDILGSIEDMSRGVALFRTLRGEGDDQTASAAITLSWAYDDQDRHAEARAMLEPIVAALRASPAASPARLADALDALANTYTASSEARQASAMRKEALAITRRVYGENHPYVEIRLNNLAFSLMREHDDVGANAAMKEAFTRRSAVEPAGSRKIGSVLNNLASTEYALGHWAEAERLWAQALEIRRKGSDPTDVAFSLTGSAGAAREQGRVDDARVRVGEALRLLRAHASPKPTHLARTLIEHVEVELALGVVECAPAEEAVALMHANASADDPQRLYVDLVAAACAGRATQDAATRQRLRDAEAALRAEFPPGAARLRQVARYTPPR